MRPQKRKRLCLGGAVLLTSAGAIYNGYPLVFSDSGTYLDSSFGLKVPLAHPAFYGVFLLLTHLTITLWPVVIAQGAIAATLIYALLEIYCPDRSDVYLLTITLILAALTPLVWFAGQIMPDAFASVLVLSLFLIVFFSERLSQRQRLAIDAVFILSVLVHYSHLSLAVGLVGAVQVWALTRGGKLLGLRTAWACLAIAVATALVFNFARTGGVFLSRVTHIFPMSRLVQEGIVQRLLRERCDKSLYVLCAYRDDLKPDAGYYLYDANSPINKLGGFVGSREESVRIIIDSLRAYPVEHLKLAIRAAVSQLYRFRAGDGLGPYGEGTWIDKVVRKRFPREHACFAASRQQQGALWTDIQPLADLYALVVLVCAIASPAVVWLDRHYVGGATLKLHAFVWVALILNASITGVVSLPNDRYQARVIWLLPLAVMVSLGTLLSRMLKSAQARVPLD